MDKYVVDKYVEGQGIDYNYVNWKVGQRLVDIDADPKRFCTLTVEEHSRERPRIGVRYDDGEEYNATHPAHYRVAS